MPIKNLIITGVNTAREINPEGSYVKDQLPGHLDSCNCNSCDKIFNDWSKAESSLKEYRIVNMPMLLSDPPKPKYPEGTKKEFDCNDENLTAIIL